ncbi:MAG: HAD family phosphatase [Bacteroidales bacterium]|nr:HAD family phosphatase [Candidatus Egerieousia equi]
MIKAIVFDMGGVLLDLEREPCLEAFHKLGYYKMEEQMDACHPTGLVSIMEHGDITAEQFCDAIIPDCNPGTTREQVKTALMAFCTRFPVYKMELIKELHKKYKVYILSNTNPIVKEGVSKWLAEQSMSFEKDFDGCFFSCDMKLQKPSPEIFQRTIAATGLSAEEILFIDDSPVNISAAKEHGLQTLLYVARTDLRQAVYSYLNDKETSSTKNDIAKAGIMDIAKLIISICMLLAVMMYLFLDLEWCAWAIGILVLLNFTLFVVHKYHTKRNGRK